MIQEIAGGNHETRKDFIECNLAVVTYAVDHMASVKDLKQDDIDHLMTIGIFGVDKAINAIVKAYNNGKNISNATIRRYVHLIVLRTIDRYFEIENKIVPTESYERLQKSLENDSFDANEMYMSKTNIDAMQDMGDIEYYDQLKRLSYLRTLIKKSLDGVRKEELEMFFSVYPIDINDELNVVQDVVDGNLGIREIGNKFGWTERQTINRMSKILRKLRTTASRCGMVKSNPLIK